MKQHRMFFALTAFLIMLSGCSVIGDIFKAGIWIGIIVVIAIIALIAFVFKMVAGKK